MHLFWYSCTFICWLFSAPSTLSSCPSSAQQLLVWTHFLGLIIRRLYREEKKWGDTFGREIFASLFPWASVNSLRFWGKSPSCSTSREENWDKVRTPTKDWCFAHQRKKAMEFAKCCVFWLLNFDSYQPFFDGEVTKLGECSGCIGIFCTFDDHWTLSWAMKNSQKSKFTVLPGSGWTRRRSSNY